MIDNPDFLLQILERLPVSILVVDPNGRVVRANEKARSFFKIRGADFGMAAGEPEGSYVSKLFQNKLESLMKKAAITGSAAAVIPIADEGEFLQHCFWITRVNTAAGYQQFAMAIMLLNEPDLLVDPD